MGSWNETDSIIGLPIKHKDPIVMIEFPERLHPQLHRSSYLVLATTISRGLYNEHGGIVDLDKVDEDWAEKDHLRAFFLQSTWNKVVALPLTRFSEDTLHWLTQTLPDEVKIRDETRERLLIVLPDYLEKADAKEKARMLGPTPDHFEFGRVLLFLDKVRKTLITRTETTDENLEEQRWLLNLISENLTTLENHDPDAENDD